MRINSIWSIRNIAFFWFAVCGVSLEAIAAETYSLKIVAFGNSLTWHRPAVNIGWNGDWGMAASSPEKDYLARVSDAVKRQGRFTPVVSRRSLSDLERMPGAYKLSADLTHLAASSQVFIVELGDNVAPNAVTDFSLAYRDLLTKTRRSDQRLLCLSTWWGNAKVDSVIESECKVAGGDFVLIGDIARLAGRKAGSESGFANPGVQAHPSDQGMAEIADRIVSVIIKR